MMSLSKLWLFVLTVVTGLLVLLFLLSPSRVQHTLGDAATSRLDLAQRSANFLLQNSARRWIDIASQLATDAVVQSSLEERGRGEAELGILHDTVQRHLRKLKDSLKVSFIILTDARGKVICRVGADEEVYNDAIDGYPLVADAIRGYRLDDLWYQRGILYRMAAAPVISAARDQYVGAVILGQRVGNELAEQVHTALGVDAVFLCNGKVVATSKELASGVEGELGQLANEHRGTSDGHVESAQLTHQRDELAAVTSLPGEAAAQGAALALLGPAPEGSSLNALMTGLIQTLGTSALSQEQLIAVGIGMAGTFFAFLLGLIFLRVEAETPYARLLTEVRTLGRKGVMKVQDRQFRGFWRELALAINQGVRTLRPRAADDSDEVSAPEADTLSGGPDTAIGLSSFDPSPEQAPPQASVFDEQRSASLHATGERRSALLGAIDTAAQAPALLQSDLLDPGAGASVLSAPVDRRTASNLPLAKNFPSVGVKSGLPSGLEEMSPSAATMPVQPFVSPYASAAQRALAVAVAPEPRPGEGPGGFVSDLNLGPERKPAQVTAREPSAPMAMPGAARKRPPLSPSGTLQVDAKAPARPGAPPPPPRDVPPIGAARAPLSAALTDTLTDSSRTLHDDALEEMGLGEREAPSPPEPASREAPQVPRSIDREAPQVPRSIDREAPQAPRSIDREAPRSGAPFIDPRRRAPSTESSIDHPTVRDIPANVVQSAIEQALMASPASYHGPAPAVLRAALATGPISSAPPPPLRAGGTPRPTTPARNIFEETTAVNRTDQKVAAPARETPRETHEELEAAFQKTYQEFIVTKQRCNEPVEGLTFEKFAVKLRQSREQILRQHNCKAVRFHVYVKDGKAALKATPVAR